MGLVLETHQDGLPGGMTSYRVYITFDESEDVLTGVLGKEGLALNIASSTQFFRTNPAISATSRRWRCPKSFWWRKRIYFDLGQPLNFADPVGGG